MKYTFKHGNIKITNKEKSIWGNSITYQTVWDLALMNKELIYKNLKQHYRMQKEDCDDTSNNGHTSHLLLNFLILFPCENVWIPLSWKVFLQNKFASLHVCDVPVMKYEPELGWIKKKTVGAAANIGYVKLISTRVGVWFIQNKLFKLKTVGWF